MRIRGFGGVYRPSKRDKRTGEIAHTGVWWLRYCHRGTVYRESSRSSNVNDAVRLLKRRVGEMGRGRLVGPSAERTTFEDLKAMLVNDYKANGRRSLPRLEFSLAHLGGHFAGARALDVTTDRATAYVAARQDEGAANATINRELAALKRMFRLGKTAGKVADPPEIRLLKEDNARRGFFERPEFEAVLEKLPEALRPLFEAAYVTGWRVVSELLTRRWAHVDFAAGWLRLEPGETKNGEGRMFPLVPALRVALERQRERTRAVERATGCVVLWVFNRDGKPIADFRRAWRKAVEDAKVPGRIPHDLRRTAVRNLERAGVPRSAAMKMVGHKTEAIYRRYAIAEEGMLREAAAKLAAFHEGERGGTRTVVPMSGAGR